MDGITSLEDAAAESKEEETGEPTEPEDELVTPSMPEDPALRGGEAEANKEGEEGAFQEDPPSVL